MIRTIFDEKNDKEIVLTPREITLLRRMQTGQVAHPEHDPYPEYVDYFTGHINIHAMNDRPEPKRRFLPSKWEWMKVMKIAKGEVCCTVFLFKRIYIYILYIYIMNMYTCMYT